MSKKKKRRSPKPRDSSSSKVQVVHSSPETKRIVKILGEIDKEAHAALQRSYPGGASRDFLFDAAILVRGINALKGIRVLVESGHWELAQGVLRQLFELVVNIEYLHHQNDRFEAMERFVRFGLVEKLEARLNEISYDQQRGHAFEQSEIDQINSYLSSSEFDVFRNKRGDFITNWASRKLKEMCDASPLRIRQHQYELLYSAWSEHAHATPGALIDSILGNTEPDWIENVMANDETRIRESVGMGAALFVELRTYLPCIEPIAPETTESWLERLLPA